MTTRFWPLLFLTLWPLAGRCDVDYRLAVDVPSRSVRMQVRLESKPGTVNFVIPSWCPGFYSLKAYERKVFDFRARDESGAVLQVSKSGSQWSVDLPREGTLNISYRVQGDDPGLGFFGTSVRERTAFVNGPSAFMFVDGRKDEKCRLEIDTPSDWSVATAMRAESGAFVADGYDELIDHPIQMGAMARRKFAVSGIPFEVVVASINDRYPDLDLLAGSLKAISEPAIAMFGSAPFKSYTYLIHLGVGDFSGGLEHRASTTIATDFGDPLDLGTLAGHEFFHAWNIKQIRPVNLGPFDYTQKVRSKHLWWSEGVTDYYAHMHGFASGVLSEADLLRELGNQVDELQSSRTRRQVTLEEACSRTWESTGFGFGDLSYYTKGLVVGLLLDASIIGTTQGKESLDDVMRGLYAAHKLPKPGFQDEDLIRTLKEVGGPEIAKLYDRCVRSTQELDYSLLDNLGMELVAPGTMVDGTGFDVDRDNRVDAMLPTVAAQGLRIGDVVDVRSIQRLPNRQIVKVTRGGIPIELVLSEVPIPSDRYILRRKENVSESARRNYERWLIRSRAR